MIVQRQIPINYCTCETFLCKKYCYDPNHQRLRNCYNCKIDGNFTGLPGHWQHRILYNCDTCAFRHNLVEICGQFTEKKDNIDNISYTLNKFFVLLHCYWGFSQQD